MMESTAPSFTLLELDLLEVAMAGGWEPCNATASNADGSKIAIQTAHAVAGMPHRFVAARCASARVPPRPDLPLWKKIIDSTQLRRDDSRHASTMNRGEHYGANCHCAPGPPILPSRH